MSRPIAVCTCVFLCVSAVAAQGPRGVVPKPAPDAAGHHLEFRDPTRVVVKFAEGTRVRLREGRLVGDVDLAATNRLLAQATRVERLFQRPEPALDAERAALLARLEQLGPDLDPPADLNNYFHVHAADRDAGLRLIDALNALAIVEIAFPEHTASVPCDPGDIPPPTPDFSGRQGYRGPAPTGIDQRASRVIPGGRGETLQFIDIESSWRLGHEDVPKLVQANVIGQHNESLNPNHGVAVCGELAAEWDRFGVSGLVDRTDLKVHSHMRQFWASSVNVAAANTPVGGFIVLEVQLTFGGRLTPMEVRQDVFDAVRNAVMAGKHVIAAAGNGGNNLDDPFFQGLFDPNTRDSGSVIVGATEGSSLVRASFSNHGSRINANGWGRDVATTGYGRIFTGGGDVRQYYTDAFSGTSSATPIVTGAAMAVAGAMREQLGRDPSPTELRDLLEAHGTDVPNGRIGKRPDLVQLLQAVGLPDGLDIPQDAGLGGTVQIELSGPAGTPFTVGASFDRGSVDLGPLGRLLLDPSNVFVPFLGTVPGTGSITLSFDVPVDEALRGTEVFLQAVRGDGNGRFRLTNSVYNFIP